MKDKNRFGVIDVFRGFAALYVMLAHFSSHYYKIFPNDARPVVGLPAPHLAVQFFFIISGFVISITLQRTENLREFLFARFSRLYPSFWAAVITTWLFTSALGSPLGEFSILTIAGNLTMIPSLLSLPQVDGVYWTLELELIFYAWISLTIFTGTRDRLPIWMMFLAGISAIAAIAERHGIVMNAKLQHALLLDSSCWFTIGIACYYFINRQFHKFALLLFIGLGLSLFRWTWVETSCGLATVVLIIIACKGLLNFLDNPLMKYFGAISYCLYLLHHQIGYSTMRVLYTRGLNINICIAIASVISILLAMGVHHLIEKPSLVYLKTWRKSIVTGIKIV